MEGGFFSANHRTSFDQLPEPSWSMQPEHGTAWLP